MPSDQAKTITRREFITRGAGALAGLTMLGGLTGLVSGAATRSRKPNILYVFGDQMRNCSLGCMGNPDVQTPNMDKLAKEGMLFTDAATTFPLCSPHRACLITGRYPLSTGVVTNNIKLPESEVTIAKVLKEQGYKTGYVGKWHLDGYGTVPDTKARQGFDFFYARNSAVQTATNRTDYAPDMQADKAIEFMKEHKDEPFCLFLSWLPPHPPYVPPKRYKGKYDPKTLKLRPNATDSDKYRSDISISYSMITGLDDNVGKLMKALDDLGIAEDTILCFSSDHGDMLGSQNRENKNLPWEESINVPLVMRYPRAIKPGQKTNLLMSTVHVMPTLLGMCGVPVPKTVEGTDLSGLILGKGGTKPDSQYILDVIPGPTGLNTGVDTWRGVRTERYMYARNIDKGWLLYDRKTDPYEKNNLIGKPESKALQDKMDAALQEWLTKTGDKFEPISVWTKRLGMKANSNKPPKAGRQQRNTGASE